MEQENSNPTTEQKPNLIINSKGSEYLKTAAKWATFLSIMGFIGTKIIILLGLFISIFSPLTSKISPTVGFHFRLIDLVYFLLACLCFSPTLYLYNFANKAKSALYSLNQNESDISLKNLKKFQVYKYHDYHSYFTLYYCHSHIFLFYSFKGYEVLVPII